MRKEQYRNFVIYFNILILIFGILLLILNVEMISVVHFNASEDLPVLVYETYSTLETSFLYLLVVLILLNVFSFYLRYLKRIQLYLLYPIPIIVLILIAILFLNPHILIFNPSGYPPTRFEGIELTGITAIILFCLFTINTLLQIYLEVNMKKYLINMGIVIGALFLSEFIHESGHAIFVLLTGGVIKSFYPFPILLGGEISAGCVEFSNVPSSLISLVLLGGEIFQWITIFLLFILFYFKPKYRRNMFLIALFIISFLDFPLYVINNSIGLPHWFLIGSTYGDIIRFSMLTNIRLWIFIGLAICQLTVMVLICYFWLYKSKSEITDNKVESEHLGEK